MDENAAKDIGEAMNELERLAVKTGAAVAFGAHFAKGNASAKDSIDRISGSGVFARDPDSILTLTRHEETGCFTLDTTLRNHPPIESFVVRWEFPLMQREPDLDPTALKQPKGRTKIYSDNDLLIHVQKPISGKDWLKASIGTGMSRSSFYAIRRKLVLSKKVRESKNSDMWELVK